MENIKFSIDRDWIDELIRSAKFYKENGWDFEKWYDYGHTYGEKKRTSRKVWENV